MKDLTNTVHNADLSSVHTEDGLSMMRVNYRTHIAKTMLFICEFDCWGDWYKLALNDTGITDVDGSLQWLANAVLGDGALTFKNKEKLFKVDIVDLKTFDYDKHYWYEKDDFLISCTRIK